VRRFGLLALFVALGSSFTAPSAGAAVPVVVVDGRGWGHGVGMAQDGAYWMGAAGASTEQILGQFYPGTGLGKARGPVRVAVLDAGPAPSGSVLAFPDGGEVRESGTGPSSAGFPLRVPAGGEVRVVWDGGRYRAEPRFATGPSAAGRATAPSPRRVELAAGVRPQIPTLPPPPSTTTTAAEPPPATTSTSAPPESTTTTAPRVGGSSSTTTTEAPPPDSAPPAPEPDSAPAPATAAPTSARPLVAVPPDGGTVALPERQRQYRGVIEATAASGTLRLVNTLDVETYLKGMGEVRDPSWPAAALRSQAIAARTYAMRAMATGGEICDTQRCQVYLGAQAEYGAMNKAVDATREQVLVYAKALASAVYSANGGGISASREEGFGVPATDAGAPYLRAAPYLTKDPTPWSVPVALTDVAARLGYAGTLTDVRVTRTGPSGRALEVTLDGSAGPKAVTGIAFDAALGLKSTLFTLRVENAVAPPPPPPPAEEVTVQAPPEEAAAVVAEEVAGPAKEERRSIEVDPDPSPPSTGGRSEEALIFASWLVLAAAGAAVLKLRPARPRPSPSAPPSAGDSP
jgi:SpoIID/LytB domain protein